MVKNQYRNAATAYRQVVLPVFIFSAILNLLLFTSPLYMMQIYDRVLMSRNEMTLLMLTLIAIGLIALYGVLDWIRARVLAKAGMRFDEMVANGVFSRAVETSLRNPAAKADFTLSDVERLREFLTGAGLIAVCDVPWVPVFLGVCFIFNPMVGWVATIGTALIFLIAIFNEVLTKKHLIEANAEGQAAARFSGATLQHAETVAAMGMEPDLRAKWLQMHRAMLGHRSKADHRSSALLALSKFVRHSLQILILAVGAYLFLAGQISSGAIVAASILMGRALQPVDMLVGQWRQVIAARQAHGRLSALFRDHPPPENRLILPEPAGHLDIEKLSVAAPGGTGTLLEGVSLKLAPGEALAVIGPSGAGKSTLVRALAGVWQPKEGTIRLDGSELQNWDSEQLGRNIGYLPQNVELFAGTIKDNIARFRASATSEDIVAAGMLANVHTLVKHLPGAYDTQIGPGGQQLSGGERQRIALARALFGGPRLVILDEPNSNLDQEGDEALIACVKALKAKGCCVVFVSHKLNLVALAEKTLVLAEGRMQRFGPTRDVLQPRSQPARRGPESASAMVKTIAASAEPGPQA